MVVPGKSYIHSACSELDEVAGLVEESVILIEAGHVSCDYTWEVARPFRRSEVIVIASRNNVDAFEVGLIDPFLVLKNVFRQTASETAIENVITAIDRLPDTFPDNHRP